MKRRILTKICAAAILLPALLLSVSPVLGQEQPDLRQKAQELYNRYEYANAATLYEKLAGRKKPRLEDLERLAYCYLQMDDYAAAERWYGRIVRDGKAGDPLLLQYAEVLKSNGKYAEAKQQLETYAKRTGNREEVAVQIAGCDSAIAWLASPTAHELRNEAVNTTLSEFSAFPVGDSVYYAGEPEGHDRQYGWTGRSYLRVYTAARGADNALSGASAVAGQVNDGSYHIGPVAASADGNTLFVTRTYPGKDGAKVKEHHRRYLTHKLELYIHTHNPDGSASIEPFPYNNVKEYSVGHAALSTDGMTLYFVSDMPGGQGGTDIWYSERRADGSWDKPVNAGAMVNSTGDELFPNIGPGGTLYFSSDGFAGMGGLDVFRSEGRKGTWSRPENLRHPVNSPGDDFAYLTTSDDEERVMGYLSSNRQGGKGGDDIYSFVMGKPKIIIILQGTASDRKTGDRLAEVSVTLFDGEREIVGRKLSDGSGRFEFELERGKSYRVVGEKAKYKGDSANVTTVGIVRSDTLDVALLLDPHFEVGKTFELKNIYYDFDKHNIRPDAARVLNELVAILEEYPTLKIELSSHTDSRGSDSYNEALSQRRAQAAVDYLVSRGIGRGRMVAKGYGETRLVNDCGNGVPCTREQHQANRRTEVTVLAY